MNPLVLVIYAATATNNREDREVQTKGKNVVKEKNVQTEIEDPCACKEKCNSYKVHFEKDKGICILKRAKCSVKEWEEYEEKI